MDERTKNLDLKGLFLLCDKWGVKKYGTKEMIRKRLAAVMPEEIPDEIPEVVEEFSTDWSKDAPSLKNNKIMDELRIFDLVCYV